MIKREFALQVDGDQTLVQFPMDSGNGKKDKDDSNSDGGSLLMSNNVRILPRDQLMVSLSFNLYY